jgi:hypothetical protein
MMTAHDFRLLSDTRGAVMLMGLFAALFLAGSLFAVVSVGDAIFYRRVMQDGADSGAFAAAVVAAKGMNFHAVLNLAMAATAGVLLVVRSVEVLLEILLAILQAMMASIVLAPKAAPLLGVLTPAEATVERIGDGVEQFVRVSHDALDVAHHAVQQGYPVLAEVRAVDAMVLRGSFEPPLVAGFVVPLLGARLPSGGRGLPVEKQSVDALCERAANAIGGSISNVRARVPRWLLRFLGGAVERALRLGKRRTCDDDVVESPRQVIAARGDRSLVWLGHEEFQYRAFAVGQDPTGGVWGMSRRGLRIANGGNAAVSSPIATLQQFGRFSFAQSEFYYDSAADKSEWLWRPRWRSRLRRFQVSSDGNEASVSSACAGVPSGRLSTTNLSGLCTALRNLSVAIPSAH